MLNRRTERDAPRWWRVLQWVLKALLVTYATGAIFMLGYSGGKAYASLSAAARGGALRIAGGFLFLMLLMLFTSAAGRDLYRNPDLSLLVTMPLTDRQRFHLKVVRIGKAAGACAAWLLVCFAGFAARLHWPWRAYAGQVLAAVLMMSVVVGLALVLSLEHWLRSIVRIALYAGLAYVGAVLAVALVLPADAIARIEPLLKLLRWPFLAHWWPGAVAADLARSIAAGSWLPAAIATAKLVLMTQVAFLLAEGLVTVRYRLEDVLPASGGAFVPRAGARAGAPKEDALAKALRARWPTRTRALLALVQRRESPEQIRPRAFRFLRGLTIAIVFAWVWRAAAVHFGFEPMVANLGLLAVAAVFFYYLLYDLQHAPYGSSLMVAGRSNGDDPLIETWPVGMREFVRLVAANDLVTLACYCGAALLAGLVLPVPFVYTALALALVATVLGCMSLTTPLVHAMSYHTDIRRLHGPVPRNAIGKPRLFEGIEVKGVGFRKPHTESPREARAGPFLHSSPDAAS